VNNPNFFQVQNKMRVLFNISAIFKSEKGVTAVYVALLIPIFLLFAAWVIDIGFIMVTKNELQNAADAAALAGASALSSEDYNTIKMRAKNVADQNKVSGKSGTVDVIADSPFTFVKVTVSTAEPLTAFFTRFSKSYSAFGVADNTASPQLIQ
jgi:Flp pilus assembly protein TadG